MFRISICILILIMAAGVMLAKDPAVITDDTITDQVRIKLASDQVVKGGALEVVVKQGVVTLGGAVEQENQRARAEKLAKKVKGVKQVVNNITIKARNAGK